MHFHFIFSVLTRCVRWIHCVTLDSRIFRKWVKMCVYAYQCLIWKFDRIYRKYDEKRFDIKAHQSIEKRSGMYSSNLTHFNAFPGWHCYYAYEKFHWNFRISSHKTFNRNKCDHNSLWQALPNSVTYSLIAFLWLNTLWNIYYANNASQKPEIKLIIHLHIRALLYCIF